MGLIPNDARPCQDSFVRGCPLKPLGSMVVPVAEGPNINTCGPPDRGLPTIVGRLNHLTIELALFFVLGSLQVTFRTHRFFPDLDSTTPLLIPDSSALRADERTLPSVAKLYQGKEYLFE